MCPDVMKFVWQLTSRPVTEGVEALKNGRWLFKGIAGIRDADMQRSNADAEPLVPSLFWLPMSLEKHCFV